MRGMSSSLSSEQAQELAVLIRTERLRLDLSMRQLAAIADMNMSTISGIEAGAFRAPQPGTLKALAGALNLSVSDIYAAIGWMPAHELPSLRPYLRAKYQELDEAAIADLERYADELSKRSGGGPLDHEDED